MDKIFVKAQKQLIFGSFLDHFGLLQTRQSFFSKIEIQHFSYFMVLYVKQKINLMGQF